MHRNKVHRPSPSATAKKYKQDRHMPPRIFSLLHVELCCFLLLVSFSLKLRLLELSEKQRAMSLALSSLGFGLLLMQVLVVFRCCCFIFFSIFLKKM
jgi:hypothetical protein